MRFPEQLEIIRLQQEVFRLENEIYRLKKDRLRGTGRTYRALKALPIDGIYIVSHSSEISYCRNLLREMGRNINDIKIITLSSVDPYLRGMRGCSISLDHFVHESCRLSDVEYDLIERAKISN